MNLREKIKTKIEEKSALEQAQKETVEKEGEKPIKEQIEAIDSRAGQLSGLLEKLQTAYEGVGVSGVAFKRNYEKVRQIFEDEEVKKYLAEKGLESPKDLAAEEQDEEISADEDVKAYKSSRQEFKTAAHQPKEVKRAISEEFGIDFKRLSAENRKAPEGAKIALEERVKARFEHDRAIIEEVLEKMKAERQELYEKTSEGRKEKEDRFRQEIEKGLSAKNVSHILKNPDYGRIAQEQDFDLAQKFGAGGEEFMQNELVKGVNQQIEQEAGSQKEGLNNIQKAIENLEKLPKSWHDAHSALIDAIKIKEEVVWRIGDSLNLNSPHQGYLKQEAIKEVRTIINNAGFSMMGDYIYAHSTASSDKDPISCTEDWLNRTAEQIFGQKGNYDNSLSQGRGEQLIAKAVKERTQAGEMKTGIPDLRQVIDFAEKYSAWLTDFEDKFSQLQDKKIELNKNELAKIEGKLLSEGGQYKVWEAEWNKDKKGGRASLDDAIYVKRPEMVLSQEVWLFLQRTTGRQQEGSLLEAGKAVVKEKMDGLNKKEKETKQLIEDKIASEWAQEKESAYLKNNPATENILSKQKTLEVQKESARALLSQLFQASQRESAQTKAQLALTRRGWEVSFPSLNREYDNFTLDIQKEEKQLEGKNKEALVKEKAELEAKKTFLGIGAKNKTEALQTINEKLKIAETIEGFTVKRGRIYQQIKQYEREAAAVSQSMYSLFNRSEELQSIIGQELPLSQIILAVSEKCQQVVEGRLEPEEQKFFNAYAKIQSHAREAAQKYQAQKQKFQETVKG